MGPRRNPRTGKRPSHRSAAVRPVAARPPGVQRWRAIARVLLWLLLAAAGTGAAVGAHRVWRLVEASERLQVKRIEVLGNARATYEEVLGYAGVRIGDAILALDLDAMALRLRRHPWIRRADVRRKLPDRIQVTLVEHEAAIIVSLGTLYLADATGNIFKRFSAADRLVLPVLTGIDAARAELETDVAEDDQVVGDGIALSRSWERQASALGSVEEVHWDVDLGWSVVSRPPMARGATVRFHLGRWDAARLALAEGVLARLTALGRQPEVIWAGFAKSAGRVHVRLAAGAWGSVAAKTGS